MTVPLFCTVNIDVKLLETFVTESSRPRGMGPYLWVLCREPSEPMTGPVLGKAKEIWPNDYSDHPDCPAIESFDTGFLNAPLEVLQVYLRQKPQIEAAKGERQRRIAESLFAVLDSRSVRDGTVALYHEHWRMPKEYFEDDDDPDWDEKVLIKELVEWRLKFLMAGFWANVLQENGVHADFDQTRGMYIDKEGVLQIPFMEHSEYNLPDLKEEEKAPWGPEKSAEEKEKTA